MGLFSRFASPRSSASLDEFVGEGEDREASPLDLGPCAARDWQAKLAKVAKSAAVPSAGELALSAFTLIRGGDLFERSTKKPPPAAARALLDVYASAQLELITNGAAAPERDAALAGVLRVLGGNPAILKRMLIARRIALVIIPKDHDFRSHGFPRHTNPHAAGIFWNSPREPTARLGLREELIVAKPHLVVHEMAHAVHFLGFTSREREDIDRFLLPVYRSRRWVEEAVAIYAERAFGAKYAPEELAQPDLYGKTRRDWDARHVFARFIDELFNPAPGRGASVRPG